jgi:hypothetical protein
VDANYLVTGCQDGSVLKWQVIDEEGQCHVRLCWGATNGSLTVIGASIQGVRGLNSLNKQLLNQRGAEGEPVNRLCESSKKLITMGSVISQWRQLSERTEEPSQQQAEQQDERQDEHQSEQQGETQDEHQSKQQGERQDEHQNEQGERQGDLQANEWQAEQEEIS